MSRKPQSRSSRPSRPDRPFRSIASQLTVDDHLALEACAAAELCGDWAAAYAAHRSIPMYAESQHGAHLGLMTDLGEQAPDWLRSRFVTTLVRRWESYGQPRRAGRVLQRTVPVLYPEAIPFERIGCEHVEQIGAWIFGRDWVVRQADVFDLGGLEDLVSTERAHGAIATAPSVREWIAARMGGWRLVAADGAVLVVADASTGEELELLDLGVTRLLDGGTHVLGRVVPTSDGPGAMFDWRPLPVDEETAAAVAADPQHWLTILGGRIADGALPTAFSHLSDASLTADLPRHAWGALLGHPVDGLDRIPRTIAAEALKKALSHALEPGGVRRHERLVVELLLDEAVDEALVTRFATATHRAGWEALTSALPAYATRWCREALWMIDATSDEGLAG